MQPVPASGALSIEPIAEIAVGRTARVDLCRASAPGQPPRLVAVKRLIADLAHDEEFMTRFLDEVWMTAALKHPNVVEVAGWGTDEGGTWLAVELVQGVSLARLMKTVFDTGEAFTERHVAYVGVCLARGLAAAHALRSAEGRLLHLVHRDLTPANVLIGFGGEVKIADFGVAKAKERLAATTMGLPVRISRQLAPEELVGQDVDHRADVFALGAVLFEMLAGRRAWVAGNDVELCEKMLKQPPADLAHLRPKVDRQLVALIAKCLEREPSKRFASADFLVGELEQWLDARGWTRGGDEALARFVRRNAMRQMRWFERIVAEALGTSEESGRHSVPDFTPPPEPQYAPLPPPRAPAPPDPPTHPRPRAQIEDAPTVGPGPARRDPPTGEWLGANDLVTDVSTMRGRFPILSHDTLETSQTVPRPGRIVPPSPEAILANMTRAREVAAHYTEASHRAASEARTATERAAQAAAVAQMAEEAAAAFAAAAERSAAGDGEAAVRHVERARALETALVAMTSRA